jgi:hypothetical protein
MLPIYIALVRETDSISPREFTRVAAALDKQVTRDFGPIWGVPATVDPVFSLDEIPVGYWPIVLVKDTGKSSGLGYHADHYGQPYALVALTDSWSLSASHECLEMLADPFGDRMVPGPHPKEGHGRVSYLVEVCDPPEHHERSYTVNDVMVSDFITPAFYDPVKAPGVRYSFTGAIPGPREVLEGGYISWRNQVNEHIEQYFVRGGKKKFKDLGKPERSAVSPREFVDKMTAHPELEQGLDSQNDRLRSAIKAEANNRRAREHTAETLRAALRRHRGKG